MGLHKIPPRLDEGLTPCIKGQPLCNNVSQLCVYDVNINGQVSYSCDASHSRECSQDLCTYTFNCLSSYCIPYRLVLMALYILHKPKMNHLVKICMPRYAAMSFSFRMYPPLGDLWWCETLSVCRWRGNVPYQKNCPPGCHRLASTVWCLPGPYPTDRNICYCGFCCHRKKALRIRHTIFQAKQI